MKNLLSLLLLILVGCKSTNVNKDADFKINNESVNLFAFIGEKISVTEFDPNNPKNIKIEIDSITKDTLRFESYVMDNGFNCKYKILKNVFNEIKNDTVEFKAYDHYGRPGFENYENVLLYLSRNEEKNEYYHHKYIFDAIKKDKNGKWKGLKGESIEKLFNEQKNGYLKARGVFENE